MQPLDRRIPLRELASHLYLLEKHYEDGIQLRVGTAIWVMRDDRYDVYVLNRSWDSSEMSREDFLNAICREVNL